MRGKEISASVKAGLVGYKPLDLSPETKAAVDADLSALLNRLGIVEKLQPATYQRLNFGPELS